MPRFWQRCHRTRLPGHSVSQLPKKCEKVADKVVIEVDDQAVAQMSTKKDEA